MMETKLNKDDLEALQEAFYLEGDGYNNRLSVNREQFCEAVSFILNKGTTEEWRDLFDKIDVTKEGVVDWDKLATHMMVELMEKDDRTKSNQVPHWKPLRNLPSPHKDVIQRVLYLKASNKYIAISKEGKVSMWDTGLNLSRSLKAGTESCRTKDVWVTSYAPLYNLNKIALTFTSKEIAVYDLSSKLDFHCQFRIQGLLDTPISLEYWSNPENINEALLVWGDTDGGVTAIHFTSANIALFERPAQATGENPDIGFIVFLKEIGKKYKNARLLMHHGHTDWVRQVCYAPNLSCIISCSTTWANSVIIGWIEKDNLKLEAQEPKLPVWRVSRQSLVQISQGVNSFDYHPRLNMLATAGVNSHVCLWNPYVVSKPTGVLRGHMASVTQVCFLKSRAQLVSFSKDKVLRIWDIQLQVCVQRLAGMFSKGPDVITTLFYDDAMNRLFLTFNGEMAVLEINPEQKDRIKSHYKPVVAALYNATYNQVVTASQDGSVSVWLMETGQKVKQFTCFHSADAEMTSISQDHSETRLMTGATDGTVKIWDYNGHCYNTLQCAVDEQSADVGQVLSLKRTTLVVGWTKYITVFRDQALHEFFVQSSDWKGGQEHTEDILAIGFHGTNTLATGSYDGQIIVWNNGSELVSRRLNQRMRQPHGNKTKFGQSKQEASAYEGFDSQTWVDEGTRTRPKSRAASRVSDGGFDENNEYGHAISRLIFLPVTSTGRAANLISCGGNGWVRFWSTSSSELVAEFVAHPRVGSIIMAIDKLAHWLVTGDVDGLIKVWEISNYCIDSREGLIAEAPELRSQFQTHLDMINSLEILVRQDRTLILSSSSDCSVQLSDINGVLIGVFGQEKHWKIEPISDDDFLNQKDKDEAVPEEVTDTYVPIVDNWRPDSRAITNPDDYRISAWQSTRLGKEYQEVRVKKRERKQPHTVPDLAYLHAEKTKKPPAGPHAALNTAPLSDVLTLLKPDFINNPHKYFSDQGYNAPPPPQHVRTITEGLHAAFDEKSLFYTKEILEMETDRKQPVGKTFQKQANQKIGSQSNISQSKIGGTVPSISSSGQRSKKTSINSNPLTNAELRSSKTSGFSGR